MSGMFKGFGAAALVLALAGGRLSKAETVVLRSGNGSIGGNDTLISMLAGPADTNFAAAFTPSDFAAADIGPAAFIIANHGSLDGLAPE